MNRQITPLAERFRSKYVINHGTGCWDWQASIRPDGYGQIGRGRRTDGPVVAHKASWMLFRGEIPGDLVIDHICRNRKCVNPLHLRLLTRGENVMCGDTIPARKKASKYCPNGHEYTEENIYKYKGKRICRECRRINDRKRR